MFRWRTNVEEVEAAATGDSGDNITASATTGTGHTETAARLDAEFVEARAAPGEEDDEEEDEDEKRRRSRIQLSPLSRTALTIRTMAGAAVHPTSGGDHGSVMGESIGGVRGPSPPPALPWSFSRTAETDDRGGGGGGEAAPATSAAGPPPPVMEGILADPVHHHSFAPDSSLLRPLWGTVRRCAGCGERLSTLFGSSSNATSSGGGDASGSDSQTVRCAGCGILAHRGCSFSSRANMTLPSCAVNAPLAAALEREEERRREGGVGGGPDDSGAEATNAADADGGEAPREADAAPSIPALERAAVVPVGHVGVDGVHAKAAAWDFQSMSKILQENIAAYFTKRCEEQGCAATSDADDSSDSAEFCDAAKTGDAEYDGVEAVVWKGEANVADRADAVKRDEKILAAIERRLSNSDDSDVEEESQKEDASALLDELRTKRPSTPPQPRSKVGTALDLVRSAKRTDSNLRIATVAGSIAGGVAGLALAGPAGAMVGAKLFQTAGVLGVLIDGTMSVGVVVAGATVGRNVAESVSAGERVLTIGGGARGKDARDSASRLVLVRPNVVVDPVWEELTAEAKRSAPANAKGGGFNIGASFAANHRRKVAEMAQKDRLKKDANIVGADEYEIPTEEKVVLLVSSALNDRQSLPGHVHRCLVADYRSRSQRRRDEAARNPRDKKSERIREPLLALAGEHDGADRPGGENCPSRAGRRDAHGVIRHVTSTLLEVRPGFGSSPRLAERTAAAVEALVFGELYSDVFGEIAEECRDTDEKLLKKIGTFEAEAQRQTDRRKQGRVTVGASASGNASDDSNIPFEEVGACDAIRCNADAPSSIRGEDISVGALEALLRLSEATAPADKLALCVDFLECISVHFSSPSAAASEGAPKAAAAGADNLLKMVCEHVLVAKVPRLNAELTFLEEFARDEQLLRGREGYALVTLQAALHYLNASDDLERDIFRHCGESEP